MARIRKYASTQNLKDVDVFIKDTTDLSDYFEIAELPRILTGGKNAFLITGTDFLEYGTSVRVEIIDANGNPVYTEPGKGIPQYYEGNAKVISAYVYEDTPFGPGTITIVGELKEYLDANGVRRKVPERWQGVYNLKWTQNILINPFLANETKVRFYRRPILDISEVRQSVYDVTQSISVLTSGTISGEAGNPVTGSNFITFVGNTDYRLKMSGSGAEFFHSMVGAEVDISSLGYTPLIKEILNNKTAKVDIPYYVESTNPRRQTIRNFNNQPYSITYVSASNVTPTSYTGSWANINIRRLDTFAGDVARLKLYRKSLNSIGDYSLILDTPLESKELLINDSSFNLEERTGYFYSLSHINEFWNYIGSSIKTVTATGSNVIELTRSSPDYDVPNDVTVAPDGTVFLRDWVDGIYKLSAYPDLVELASTHSSGETSGFCVHATADFVYYGQKNPSGDNIDRIIKTDHDFNFIADTGSGDLNGLIGVTVDTQGNVIIVCNGPDKIVKLDSDLVFIKQTGSAGGGDTDLYGFATLWDVATDSSDNIYTVDNGYHNLRKYNSNLEFITSRSLGGAPGTGSDEFDGPQRVNIDSNDLIYVTDMGLYISGNFTRIKIFDTDLNYITHFTPSDNGARGIGFDTSNRIHLGDRTVGISGVIVYNSIYGGLLYNQSILMDSSRIQGTDVSKGIVPATKFQHVTPVEITEGTEYTVTFKTICLNTTGLYDSKMEIFVSGSGISPDIAGSGNLLETLTAPKSLNRFDFGKREINFKGYEDGEAILVFTPYIGDWYISDVSIRASQETAFSPDYVNYVVPMPTDITNETFRFKAEFFDVNSNKIPIVVESNNILFVGRSRYDELVFKGSYVSGSNYVKNDIVTYGMGSPYVSTGSYIATTTVTPTPIPLDGSGNLNTPPWEIYAQGGETGPSGSPGPSGSDGASGSAGLPGTSGSTGPGLLYIGYWGDLIGTRVLNNNTYAQDAVSYNTDKYYAYIGPDQYTVATAGAPDVGGDTEWFEFTQFSAIATGLLITENSYVKEVLNIGTSASGSSANITLDGSSTSPYISLGQTAGIGYDQTGFWVGLTGGAPGAASLSLKGASNSLTWNGTTLTIVGGGTFTGTLSAGVITAPTGDIGGFTIGSSQLYTGTKSTITSAAAGVYIGNDGIAVGTSSPFKVTAAGLLKATSATISGAITATSGTFTGIINASGGTFTGYVNAGNVNLGIGAGGGGNDGIYVNSNNYWYQTGAGKVGGTTSYISWSTSNVSIASTVFDLDATGISMDSSAKTIIVGDNNETTVKAAALSAITSLGTDYGAITYTSPGLEQTTTGTSYVYKYAGISTTALYSSLPTNVQDIVLNGSQLTYSAWITVNYKIVGATGGALGRYKIAIYDEDDVLLGSEHVSSPFSNSSYISTDFIINSTIGTFSNTTGKDYYVRVGVQRVGGSAGTVYCRISRVLVGTAQAKSELANDGMQTVSNENMYFRVKSQDPSFVRIYSVDSVDYALRVDGKAAKTGGGSWTSTSDASAKENINSISPLSGLNNILLLNPINFEFKKEIINDNRMRSGFTAQDYQQIFPQAVSQQSDGLLAMDTDDLLPALVSSVQYLTLKVADLERRLKGKSSMPTGSLSIYATGSL